MFPKKRIKKGRNLLFFFIYRHAKDRKAKSSSTVLQGKSDIEKEFLLLFLFGCRIRIS